MTMLSRFHRTAERDGQTDGRTGLLYQCRASFARQYADARQKWISWFCGTPAVVSCFKK